MNVEYQDDCNGAANRTAVTEHVIWMLYLDHVGCNVVSNNYVGKKQFTSISEVMTIAQSW